MKKLKLIFPCTFDWDVNKTGVDRKYCTNCKKVIRDYSSQTDHGMPVNKIIPNEITCGRFHSSQVTFNISNYLITNLKPITLSILTLLGIADEQELVGQTKDPSHAIDSTKFSKLKFPLNLNGQIKDKTTNEEVPFASVVLFHGAKQIGVSTTNMEGRFSFTLNKDDGLDSLFSLSVSFPGYTSLTNYKFSLSDSIVNSSIFNLSLHLVPKSFDSKEEFYYVGYIHPDINAPTVNEPSKRKTRKRKNK